MITVPQITINNKTYKLNEPKAAAWRELTKLQAEMQAENADLEVYAKIIEKAFNREEVTSEAVLENINISDLMPLSFGCITYINQLVNTKLEKIVKSKN